MKHVELHFHYLRQLVWEKVITLVYCRTNDQIVDIFTKCISEEELINFCTFLGIQEVVIIGVCSEAISPLEYL